jgi:hypothetical protein
LIHDRKQVLSSPLPSSTVGLGSTVLVAPISPRNGDDPFELQLLTRRQSLLVKLQHSIMCSPLAAVFSLRVVASTNHTTWEALAGLECSQQDILASLGYWPA